MASSTAATALALCSQTLAQLLAQSAPAQVNRLLGRNPPREAGGQPEATGPRRNTGSPHYERRKGNPRPGKGIQLPEPVKEARNQDLLAVMDKLARSKMDVLIGTRQQILCEGPSKTNSERLMGRTPQNKIVVFEGDVARHTGQVFDVMIQRSTGFTLYGDPAIVA